MAIRSLLFRKGYYGFPHQCAHWFGMTAYVIARERSDRGNPFSFAFRNGYYGLPQPCGLRNDSEGTVFHTSVRTSSE